MKGQTYQPALQFDRTWNVRTFWVWPPYGYYDTDTIRVFGDTAIAGSSYTRVGYDESTAGLLREDTSSGRMWFYNTDDQSEYLIWDLSLEVGDSVYTYEPFGLTGISDSLTVVDSVYYITDMTGDSLKVLKVEDCTSGGNVADNYWIEKAGPIAGLAFLKYPCGWSDIPSQQLLCAYDGGAQFFMNWEADSCFKQKIGLEEFRSVSAVVYPNPAANYFFVNAARPLTMDIISPEGRILRTTEVPAGEKFRYSVIGLSSGFYVVRFRWDDHVEFESLVVE